MIFTQNAINTRKNLVATALSPALSDQDVVLVFAGPPIQKPGGHDQTYTFLPHPDYFWLTGSRRPFGVSAFNKKDGWIDFVLPISREEKIWEGGGEHVIPGEDVNNFDSWLAKRAPAKTYLIGQFDHHRHLSKVAEEERLKVQELFNVIRRVKDQEEIKLIHSIALMANEGYKKIKNIIRPGLTERQIQIEYETEVLRAGAEKFPYDSIVGTGTNSAVLHAIPTARVLKEGEHVLIDAGADLHDYCVDITRNFSVTGTFSSRQKMIHDIVLKAQETSIALCRPGVEWRDVHLASAKVMAQGLHDLGILKISSDEAIETSAIAVFFPHGVGHMVGLRVRDVGGPYNPNPKKYAGARLRVDMPLKEGHLMTVEPGLYFIPALLDDEMTRKDFKDAINWTEVEKWKDFGGIRIEDDIHVTSNGPFNLTSMVEK